MLIFSQEYFLILYSPFENSSTRIAIVLHFHIFWQIQWCSVGTRSRKIENEFRLNGIARKHRLYPIYSDLVDT
mgnify:CR=1 FL=1